MPSATNILDFILPDIAVLIVAAKFIFKDFITFEKSLTNHFWPEEVLSKPDKNWAQKNAPEHKIKILYGVALALLGVNILVYVYFLQEYFLSSLGLTSTTK